MAQTATKVTVKDFASSQRPTWCPGCGDFGILTALRRALADLNIAPHEVMIVSGIGCGSKITDYIHANGFMTIHGRPLAVATGFALANPKMHVIVINGDGDAYGIGGNHFIHTCRRNPNLTHIVQNNQIYALTKGQYSPTSSQGFRTTTSPDGAPEQPILPTELAFAAGAGFIARGYAGAPQDLMELIKAAIGYRGYALIDVLQPCTTFNKLNTYEWYEEQSYSVCQEAHFDPADAKLAADKVREWDQGIPLGVLYERTGTPSYDQLVPALQTGSLLRRPTAAMGADTFNALKGEFL